MGKPIIKTAKRAIELTDEYLDLCDDNKRPYTLAGWILHLGYKSRHGIKNLKSRGPAFAEAVEYARLRMEERLNEKLLKPGQPTVGIIFNLKNLSEDWNDRKEVTGKGGGALSIVYTSNIDRNDTPVDTVPPKEDK